MDFEQDKEAIQIIDTTQKAEVKIGSDSNMKENNIIKEILSYVIIIIIAFYSAKTIHTHVFTPVSVSGQSMEPTVHNQDFIILWRRGEYKRNDVVVFKAPSGDYYIKRLIGLPGDYVSYEDDQLYINGELVDEPYIDELKQQYDHYTPDFTLEQVCRNSTTDCTVDGTIQIPEGYYFVLGDNRPNSYDSTELGLIESKEFIGKAKFILYPFKRIGNL